MSESFPTVHLVRHGETAWSRGRQHTGRSDIPLTEAGEREAQALKARLQGVQFATVLSSPLIRARRTAELAGFAERVKDDAHLVEWDYGSYEGRRTAEIRAERADWHAFVDGYPGGETLAEIGMRADRVIAHVKKAGGNALLFAHRDILRVVAARWIGLPAQEGRAFLLETASVSVLGYHHDMSEPVIRSLNNR